MFGLLCYCLLWFVVIGYLIFLVSYFGLRVVSLCYCVVVTVVLFWLFVCVDFGLFGLFVGCLMLFNCWLIVRIC